MQHFSGLAWRVVRNRPRRDSRERWRQYIAPAGLSGAAMDVGCDASVKTPPWEPKSAHGRRARAVWTGNARAQTAAASSTGADSARGTFTGPSSELRCRRAL